MVDEGYSPLLILFLSSQKHPGRPLTHVLSEHELGNHMVVDAPSHKMTESEFEAGSSCAFGMETLIT